MILQWFTHKRKKKRFMWNNKDSNNAHDSFQNYSNLTSQYPYLSILNDKIFRSLFPIHFLTLIFTIICLFNLYIRSFKHVKGY